MGRRIISNIKSSRRELNKTSSSNDLGQYMDRLKNLIPTEISALYVFGKGFIPEDKVTALILWVLFCLFCTILLISTESRYEEGKPDIRYPISISQVIISSISFLIWVYALGNPFIYFNIYFPWLGSLLIIGWTFIVPYIYRGKQVFYNE